ncbi:hypothetical protein C2W62_47705 [Candidatus Entotheonella serta]|nr:hypothetical protein C2W62_47705 [Candidatus Entotheonella serta]
MAERIALEQSLDIWAQNTPHDVHEHAPISMLFDFVRQALSDAERDRLLRHLTFVYHMWTSPQRNSDTSHTSCGLT